MALLKFVQELWVHALGGRFELLKGLLVLVYDPLIDLLETFFVSV